MADSTEYYPPVGFYFKVEFEGIGAPENDAKFQSVSGLSADIQTEEVAEGGENRFKHKLPVKAKFSNLVLKRGMLLDSEVIDWCKEAIENFEFTPINLNVKLLNEEGQPLVTWKVSNAFPVKWSVDAFNSEESKLVAETIELSYNYFTTETA